MHVHVNGARLWFDVEGTLVVPDGASTRTRPTIVLVHGGPGSYDHSYFKPHFGRLAERAQVVYLDLRGHGRSEWGRPEEWSFEACADDIRAFCDALGIEPSRYRDKLAQLPACLNVVEYRGESRPRLVLWNDTSHWSGV